MQIKSLLFLFFFALHGFAVGQADASSVNTPRQGKDYAYFFAVSQYDDSLLINLDQTIVNAKQIAKTLNQAYGFETKIFANPTLKEITDQLKFFKENYGKGILPKNGQLLLFFSGHGVKEYGNGYFLPKDANAKDVLSSALAYDIWRPFISTINCDHILVAIDACYSVTFDPSSNTMSGFERPGGELTDIQKLLENYSGSASRIFFTSDSKEDKVPGQSNFAQKFHKGLVDLKYQSPFFTYSKLFTDYIEQAFPPAKKGYFEKNDPNSSFLFFPKLSKKFNPDKFNQNQRDINAYKALVAAPSLGNCQKYLEDFPAGQFHTEVSTLLLQLEEEQVWEIAKLKNKFEGYQQYLNRYPYGKFKTQAESQLAQFQKNRFTPNITQLKQNNNPVNSAQQDNFIYVKGGEFQMGNQGHHLQKGEGPFYAGGEGGSWVDEQPAHPAILNAFYVSPYEVTFQEYDLFCSETNRQKPSDQGWGREKRPVINVNWYDAIEYCNWLSNKRGLTPVYRIKKFRVDPSNKSANDNIKWEVTVTDWQASGYRLLTEAEWEYAARSRGKEEGWAGTSNKSGLLKYVNSKELKDGYEYTAPVGSFQANRLGLYDMSGNAWEWCWDWYNANYYSNIRNSSNNPKGAPSGSRRVLRGGSFSNDLAGLRCARRHANPPYSNSYTYGFRICRSTNK